MTIFLLCIAAIKSLFDFLSTLLIQISTAMFGDTLTYFALGRALLKGFTLYKDIYDTKPPGIFLLAAASLAFTRNELLANIAQAFAFLFVALCVTALAWNEAQSASKTIRRSILLLGFFLGIVLAQYTALRSGGNVQTEPIGAAACLAYALLLARDAEHFRLRHVLLATLCMTLAVGLKEPFILILCAEALLFCPSIRSFFRAFLLPSFLTAIVGILALQALGALHAYCTLSLPELLFGKYTFAHISPWIGAFNFLPIVFDFWKFSPALLCLVAMIVLTPLLLATPKHRWGTTMATLSLFLLPAVPFCALILWAGMMGLRFTLRSVLLLPLLQGSWASALLWCVVFLTGLLLFCNVLLLRHSSMHWKKILLRILRFSVVILLTFGVVGLRGKYYPHYFIFAVPLLAAFFALFLRTTIQLAPKHVRLLLGISTFLSVLILITLPFRNPFPLHLDLPGQRQNNLETAARFDALLDACKQDRYLAYSYETEQLWAFTDHTPYGSSFSHMTWTADRTSPSFQALYAQRLSETSIIVLDPIRLPELKSENNGALWNDFGLDPPPCAQPFLPVGEYLVLFRKRKS